MKRGRLKVTMCIGLLSLTAIGCSKKPAESPTQTGEIVDEVQNLATESITEETDNTADLEETERPYDFIVDADPEEVKAYFINECTQSLDFEIQRYIEGKPYHQEQRSMAQQITWTLDYAKDAGVYEEVIEQYSTPEALEALEVSTIDEFLNNIQALVDEPDPEPVTGPALSQELIDSGMFGEDTEEMQKLLDQHNAEEAALEKERAETAEVKVEDQRQSEAERKAAEEAERKAEAERQAEEEARRAEEEAKQEAQDIPNEPAVVTPDPGVTQPTPEGGGISDWFPPEGMSNDPSRFFGGGDVVPGHSNVSGGIH